MPAVIVQTKTVTQNTATAQISLSFDQPVAAGNEIILVVGADAYVNSGNIPVGFSEPDGARQERYLGHYMWHKTAVGGEQTFTATPQVSCSHVAVALEVSGLSGTGSLLASAGQAVGYGVGTSYTTPEVTLSAGERFIVASIGGADTRAFSGMVNWTNSYTEIFDIWTTVAAEGTNDSLGVATRQLTASAGQLTSTGATWSGKSDLGSRTGMIFVFNVGAPDSTPPSVPSNVRVVQRTSSEMRLAWNEATDNVAVKEYEVFVNGSSHTRTTQLSALVSGLSENTSYILAVRAFDSAGNVSATSSSVTMATLEGAGKYVWTGVGRQLLDSRAIDPTTHYSQLARVPWEGGPSYYQQFAGMAGTEWTSDAFFPIGYWGALIDNDYYIQRYKDVGINTLWTTYNTMPESAQWIREAGLWNLGGTLPGGGTEHVGYVVEDEVDMWAGGGWGAWTGATGFVPNVCASGQQDCGYTIMQQTEAAFPQDNKLRWTNIGMTIFTHNEGHGSAYVNGVTPEGSWPMHLVTTDLYFYTGGGTVVVDAEAKFGIPAAAARRAGNYGEVLMPRLRAYDGMQGGRKPLGVIVELGGQNINGEEMNPDKVSGAVWSTIIHEARCVSYFSHAFAQTTDNPYSNNVLYSSGGIYPQIQARVQKINAEITSLAPVLNTQSYEWQGAGDIVSMMKIKDGYAYFFTMAKVAAVHETTTRTFVLPFGVNGSTAEVMFEGRTIPVRGGAIHDNYASETTYHIYRVALI